MANPVCEVLLTNSPLECAAEIRDVDPTEGAIVDFRGVVRELEDGREIDGIDYESHPTMAEHQLQLVAETAAAKFGLSKVVLYHRVGFVRAGEPSLFLQLRAQHRAAAFEASKWIVDELKKKVPIWKRPRFKMDDQAQPGSTLPATTRRMATK